VIDIFLPGIVDRVLRKVLIRPVERFVSVIFPVLSYVTPPSAPSTERSITIFQTMSVANVFDCDAPNVHYLNMCVDEMFDWKLIDFKKRPRDVIR
jgi:hypothetical protein